MQLSNFLDLEQADTLENVERVQNTVSARQVYIDYTVRDWACWDDTYQFIEDRNQRYIDVDLQNETLAGIRVNVMLFVNESGSVVYAKSVDIDSKEERPVPAGLLKMIEDGTLLTKRENDTKSGIVLLDEGPMFIACHPILTTKYEGPSKGTLIFGRFFDNYLLESFKDTTRSSLSMYRIDREMPPDFQEEFSKFLETPDRILVEPLSEEIVAGYLELRDISGEPALIIRADFPRDLYLHGERTLNDMYFLLLFTGLLTGIGIKFALDRLFISRLVEIDDFVTKVRSEKDLSKRLFLKDNDELYRLSKEINEMLNEIDLADQELKTQEREKKVLLDSLDELVVFVNPEMRIIWANKAALKHMQMDLDGAKLVCLKDTLGISSPLFECLQLEQVFAAGKKHSGDFDARDGKIWFVQVIPVTDDEGKIIGVLETCRDITESRKAEQIRKKEINHRIKNNLQIVSSLLDLQAEQFSDVKVIEAFKESESRIVSMSLIHQELYESGNLDILDFSSYLRKLIADLCHSYRTESSAIRVNLNVEKVFLGVDTAVSLGIIINELFTNSIKYAFPRGKGGEINIELFGEEVRETVNEKEISGKTPIPKIPDKGQDMYEQFTLVFADSGRGFPEGLDITNTESLGLQLVNALVDQIEGSIDLERGNCTKFTLKFREKN